MKNSIINNQENAGEKHRETVPCPNLDCHLNDKIRSSDWHMEQKSALYAVGECKLV